MHKRRQTPDKTTFSSRERQQITQTAKVERLRMPKQSRSVNVFARFGKRLCRTAKHWVGEKCPPTVRRCCVRVHRKPCDFTSAMLCPVGRRSRGAGDCAAIMTYGQTRNAILCSQTAALPLLRWLGGLGKLGNGDGCNLNMTISPQLNLRNACHTPKGGACRQGSTRALAASLARRGAGGVHW